jgi:hypothetical protein
MLNYYRNYTLWRDTDKKFREENIMETRGNKYYLTMACSALIVLCFVCVALGEKEAQQLPETQQLPTQSSSFKKKADLIVEKIEIIKVAQEPVYVSPDTPTKVKYKVKITVTVKNRAVGMTAASTADSLTAEGRRIALGGDFVVAMVWESIGRPASVDWRVSALAPGESTNMMSAGTTMTAFEWMPKGATKEFRVTVDNLNWIDESSETNNTKTAVYLAE